jgi:chromosome segregation ATPase
MNSRNLLVVIIAATLAFPAAAETVRREGGADQAALIQAQALAQQAGAERDALQAENSKLKDQLAAAKKEAAHSSTKNKSLQKRLDSTESTLERFKDAQAQAVERLRDTQERLGKLVDKYKELIATLRDMETQKAHLQDTVNTQSAQLDDCAKHNVALYKVDQELLEKYRDKGVWDALKQREPVTGLAQVKVESMIEQYRMRLDKEQVSSAAVSK